MGQGAPSPASSPRTERPARRTRPPPTTKGPGQTKAQTNTTAATNSHDSSFLMAEEEERHRVPTLKEQWQTKREANALVREANAAERKRKKEVLHAALVAQQKQAEKDEQEANSAGNGDGEDEDAETLRLRHQAAQAEAALTEAQVNAQLAVFQAFMANNPDVEEELSAVDGTPASLFNREAATKAARKATQTERQRRHGKADGNADSDEEAIANVSVHSSDYEDEELLQGLNDLDEELEAEFQQNIESLQAQVTEHKQKSLEFLREHQDKPAALEELQKAKQIEARIKQLLDNHDTPLRVQVEAQERRVADLEELVATRKQESLTALRGGDKPTALEKLKESKAFQSQVDEARAKLAELEEAKAKQLRSTGAR